MTNYTAQVLTEIAGDMQRAAGYVSSTYPQVSPIFTSLAVGFDRLCQAILLDRLIDNIGYGSAISSLMQAMHDTQCHIPEEMFEFISVTGTGYRILTSSLEFTKEHYPEKLESPVIIQTDILGVPGKLSYHPRDGWLDINWTNNAMSLHLPDVTKGKAKTRIAGHDIRPVDIYLENTFMQDQVAPAIMRHLYGDVYDVLVGHWSETIYLASKDALQDEEHPMHEKALKAAQLVESASLDRARLRINYKDHEIMLGYGVHQQTRDIVIEIVFGSWTPHDNLALMIDMYNNIEEVLDLIIATSSSDE